VYVVDVDMYIVKLTCNVKYIHGFTLVLPSVSLSLTLCVSLLFVYHFVVWN
jgi:hypothetical protein